MIYTLLKENQQMGLNPESNEKKYIVIAKEISIGQRRGMLCAKE